MDKTQYDLAKDSIAKFATSTSTPNEIIIFDRVKVLFITLEDLYTRHEEFVNYFTTISLSTDISIKVGKLVSIKHKIDSLVSELSRKINLYTNANDTRTVEMLKEIWNYLTPPSDAPVDTTINVCVQKYITLYKELLEVKSKGGRGSRKRSKMPRRRHRSTRRSIRRRRS